MNEEVDPSLVIRRLKQENLALRQELQLLKGGGGGAEGPGEGGSGEPGGGSGGGGRPWQTLGEEEEAALRQQVLAFVEDASPEAALNVEASMVAIRTGGWVGGCAGHGLLGGSESLSCLVKGGRGQCLALA